jgi:ParB family chromosome partitioning protein
VAESLSVRDLERLVKERLDLESGLGSTSDPADARDDTEQPDTDKKLRPPGLMELAELLAPRLDTRVAIAMTSKRGKVTIDFANLEDLERIYRLIIE